MFNLRDLIHTPPTERWQHYHDLLLALPELILAFLLRYPEWIERIQAGEDLPAHVTAAVEEQLPGDLELRRRVRAYIQLCAKKLAARLTRSEPERDRLNAQYDAAVKVREQGRSAPSGSGIPGEATRDDVHAVTGELAALNDLIRGLERQIAAARRAALGYFAGAAGTLGGEVATIAAARFRFLPNPDTFQRLGTWCLAAALAGCLMMLVSRGIAPLLDPEGDGTIPPRGRRQVGIMVGLTVVISGAIAGIRVIATGAGGWADLAEFLLNLIAVPFLALLAEGFMAAGRRALASTDGLKGQLAEKEAERARLDAELLCCELADHELATRQKEAQQAIEQALKDEAAAVGAKEALLAGLLQEVIGSPEIRRLAVDLARAAAALDGQGREEVTPRWWRLFAVALTAGALGAGAPLLSGCGAADATFGGTVPRRAVVVYFERTGSLTDPEAFLAEARREFGRFVDTAAPGSRFELLCSTASPGLPRTLFACVQQDALPRDRARRRLEAIRSYDAALKGLGKPGPQRWSAPLEDGYRTGERAGALAAESRRVVVMSDFLQYSRRLKSTTILRQGDPQPLIDAIVKDYPPFRVPPDEVRLVHQAGTVAPGIAPDPAATRCLLDFTQALWEAWGAKRVETTESGALTGGAQEAVR